MKLLLILPIILSFYSCLNKDKAISEPISIDTKTESITNTGPMYDHSGELALNQVKIKIEHSRDKIKVNLRPTKRTIPVWDYLEKKVLSQVLSTNRNRSEQCEVTIKTFREFDYGTIHMKNIKPTHIEIKLNSSILNINQDYQWSVLDDQIEIVINNPHLKGAQLTIENKTLRVLHYKKIDLRACAETKNLKHRKNYEGHQIDIPEHYSFDYKIY